MTNSKEKGKRGERELAGVLRQHGYKYDNMPPGILFAELANELAKINEMEKRMRTEEDT